VRVDLEDGSSVVLEPWQSVVTAAAAGRVALVPGGERTSVLVVHPRPDLATARQRASAALGERATSVFFAQFASGSVTVAASAHPSTGSG
jgi:hypothetical protein